MYQMKMEVFMQGTSPTGTKFPQRNVFTHEAKTVRALWRWVNRKRKSLRQNGFRITSCRYVVTEV